MISIVRLVANAVKASLAILKHTQKFYPISTQLRIEKRQNREIGTSRYSEMVAVDAIGVCFQSTSKFPSWTSRELPRSVYGNVLSSFSSLSCQRGASRSAGFQTERTDCGWRRFR